MFVLKIITYVLVIESFTSHAYGDEVPKQQPNKKVQQVMEGAADILNSTTTTMSNMSRPYGREHVTQTPVTSKKAETIIPISEATESDASEKMDHKKIIPRKGVNFTNEPDKSTNAATVLATTSTPVVIKKPTVTVDIDDEPYNPSHFKSSKTKYNATQEHSLETYEPKTSNTSHYLVPIVAVILSVPLVALLSNYVYRRTKEWWHHRHYRRMDFLIDGIYNN